MMTSDVERGEGPEEQALTNETEDNDNKTRQCRRTYVTVIFLLIAIGLIVGLSVGLTRPKGEASLNDDGNNPTSQTNTTRVKFQSSGRAFDVTLDLLSPAVLEGYDDDDDLKADLGQAVRFYLNNFIEDQIRHRDDITMTTSPPPGPTPPPPVTDFETNNQVDGVDEADTVKSDGTYVYAAYGDAIVVWEAVTGTYVTNYTLPALDESYSYSGTPAPPSISGMSLESNRLVVYARGYGHEVVATNNVSSACPNDAYATRVLIFSTTTITPSSPLTLIAQKDVHGSFRDARAIGDDIHMVTTCAFDFSSITGPLDITDDVFVDMTDEDYRKASAKTFEPLIDAFVELMVKDIHTNGNAKIPKVSFWGTEYGSDTSVVEQANADGAIQAFTSLVSFSVANLSDEADGELALSCAGACTPSSFGYTYTIDGWVVFAAEGWEWNRDLGGTSQSTYLMGFSINGTTASPAIIGSFPGYILNQYSLSIYEGHLRVATTIDSWYVEPIPGESGDETLTSRPSATAITLNQVIILKVPTAASEMMEEVSRISNLGDEGGNITAINYFGPIAYVGTFNSLVACAFPCISIVTYLSPLFQTRLFKVILSMCLI